MSLRTGRGEEGRGRRAVATGLLAGLIAVVASCAVFAKTLEASAIQEDQDAPPAALGDLQQDLNLTDDQLAGVREVLDTHRARAEEPGTLWRAAADLQDILTSEQISKIRSRIGERPAGPWGPQGGARVQGDQRAGHRGARPPRPEGRRRVGSGGLAWPDLELTDEQSSEIKAIRDSFRPRLQEIRDAVREGALSREEAGEQMEAVRDEIHAAAEEVLTEDQRAALEASRAEREALRREAQARRQEMQAQQEARRDEMRAQAEARREAERTAMVETLGLSDEQVAAIDALREGARAADRPANRAEADARRQAHRAALLAILDDEQAEIWVLHAALRGHLGRQTARGSLSRGHGRRPARDYGGRTAPEDS